MQTEIEVVRPAPEVIMRVTVPEHPCAGIKVWLLSEVGKRELVAALARRELRGWMGDHQALADLQLIVCGHLKLQVGGQVTPGRWPEG
ncbi:hypothetical protein, partial [Nonomuraea ferruginea]|uniref:hypothetical protein n=1 Tax=Nonomuraea ferruginea TaxID=46174 RepID=UPI0036162EE3